MDYKNHINFWINTIKVSREELNGFSICPYVNKAHKIEIEEVNNVNDIFIPSIDFDVKIFIVNIDLSEKDLENMCFALSERYKNLVFLPDHKDSSFGIGKLKTGNNRYNFILCQSREKLDHYRKMLKKTSYYDCWNKVDLEKIFKF
jgi:hypothetical protein